MATLERSTLDAVVLAGAPNTGRLSEISDEQYEALIDLGGKPIVRYPVEALLAARTIGPVVVVGPPAELKEALAGLDVEIIPPTGGMFENALAGCRHIAARAGERNRLVFFASADSPLITPEVVDGLVETCLARGGDLFYPVLERSVMEAKFPSTRRTYGRLRDGTYTGGNVFLVDAAVLERERSTAEALIRARKNPLKLAQTLGFTFLVRLLLGRLTVPELETHVSKTFNLTARAVIAPWAEIGIDVDKPEDLELVREHLVRSTPPGV